MPQMDGRKLADRPVPLHPTLKVLMEFGYTEDVIVHHAVLDETIHFR